MSKLMDNPKHWRDRADEARALEAELTDPVARDTMRQIATGYDYIADRIEARQASRWKPVDQSG